MPIRNDNERPGGQIPRDDFTGENKKTSRVEPRNPAYKGAGSKCCQFCSQHHNPTVGKYSGLPPGPTVDFLLDRVSHTFA